MPSPAFHMRPGRSGLSRKLCVCAIGPRSGSTWRTGRRSSCPPAFERHLGAKITQTFFLVDPMSTKGRERTLRQLPPKRLPLSQAIAPASGTCQTSPSERQWNPDMHRGLSSGATRAAGGRSDRPVNLGKVVAIGPLPRAVPELRPRYHSCAALDRLGGGQKGMGRCG